MKSRLFSSLLVLTLLAGAAYGQDRTIRVACIGNSITIGSGGSTAWPQQLGQRLGAHYTVRNFGVSGTTMLRHGDFPYWNESAFLQAQDFDPHIVIISLGTNDSKPQNRVDLGEMFDDYMAFIRILRAQVDHADRIGDIGIVGLQALGALVGVEDRHGPDEEAAGEPADKGHVRRRRLQREAAQQQH